MRLAGIAGLVAMLVFALPASAGRDETKLEHQVRSYVEQHNRYQQMFGLPDDARLGRVFCGKAGEEDDLVCGFTRVGRFFVTRGPHGTFDFATCPFPNWRDGAVYNYEDNPCSDEIDRG